MENNIGKAGSAEDNSFSERKTASGKKRRAERRNDHLCSAHFLKDIDYEKQKKNDILFVRQRVLIRRTSIMMRKVRYVYKQIESVV